MKILTIEPEETQLKTINEFIDDILENYEISMESKFQLKLIIEEIFINIVNYAYDDKEEEKVKIISYFNEDSLKINLQFFDNGKQFNPLKVKEIDAKQNIKERNIGGLGILLMKKNVDDIYYDYKDNSNILTIEKKLKKK